MGENNTQDLKFLHSTSTGPKQIVAVRLYDYLKQYQNHATIKGINIQKIKQNQMESHLQAQIEHKAQSNSLPAKIRLK